MKSQKLDIHTKLKLGAPSLDARQALILDACLHMYSTGNELPWSFSTQGPFDVALVHANDNVTQIPMTPDGIQFAFNDSTNTHNLPVCPLTFPPRITELKSWLLSIQKPFLNAQDILSGQLKLIQWPNPTLLAQQAWYAIASSLLCARPFTLAQLPAALQRTEAECLAFAQTLLHSDFLQPASHDNQNKEKAGFGFLTSHTSTHLVEKMSLTLSQIFGKQAAPQYKLLFSGTVGAGKTTAIQTISDIPVVRTDVKGNERDLGKTSTTVGLDYGAMTTAAGDTIRLFGTPGQKRFDFLWHTLFKGAMGVVILADDQRPDALDEVCDFVDTFIKLDRQIPMIVGVGRLDAADSAQWALYRDRVAARAGRVVPVVPVDVRNAAETKHLVSLLMTQIKAISYVLK